MSGFHEQRILQLEACVILLADALLRMDNGKDLHEVEKLKMMVQGDLYRVHEPVESEREDD